MDQSKTRARLCGSNGGLEATNRTVKNTGTGHGGRHSKMSTCGTDDNVRERVCGSGGSLCEATMAMGAGEAAVAGGEERLERERGVVVWWAGTHSGRWS